MCQLILMSTFLKNHVKINLQNAIARYDKNKILQPLKYKLWEDKWLCLFRAALSACQQWTVGAYYSFFDGKKAALQVALK